MFAHVKESGEQRWVHVIRDPDWQFWAEGPVQSFEDAEAYKRRRIWERLTPRMVVRYFNRLGWDLDSADFWRSNGNAWTAMQTRSK